VFVGICLLHRYDNKRDNTRFSDLGSLLSERECHDAEVVGKAMRFAAMLWLKKDARLGELRWHPRKKVLDLYLSQEATPLFGEVAETRFKALASALNAEAVVH
jgi:exopolyphosphatase/guanosine-5'-triphosphate,3'-diphosphate pyrophosphatase